MSPDETSSHPKIAAGSVLLFSGGLDSTVCLHDALERYPRQPLSALFIDYGQRNSREEYSAAVAISAGAGVPLYVERMHIPSLTGALCTDELVTNENKVVEGRNTVLLSVAAIYAKRLRVERIVIGVTHDDQRDFLDCRPQFIRHLARSFSLGFGMHMIIGMPLVHKTKAEVVKFGLDHDYGDAMARSWSCYAPKEREVPCRECPACVLRIESMG